MSENGAKSRRVKLRLALSGAVITAVAAGVVFAGLWWSGTGSSQPYTTPSPDPDYGFPIYDPRLKETLNRYLATPTPSQTADIGGEVIPLPDGMAYNHYYNVHGGEYWLLEYHPDWKTFSWITFDSSGRVTGSNVAPEHMGLFQPFLDAAQQVGE